MTAIFSFFICRRKQNNKFNDLQNQYTDLVNKNSQNEKTKIKLQNEIDILHQDIDKVSNGLSKSDKPLTLCSLTDTSVIRNLNSLN